MIHFSYEKIHDNQLIKRDGMWPLIPKSQPQMYPNLTDNHPSPHQNLQANPLLKKTAEPTRRLLEMLLSHFSSFSVYSLPLSRSPLSLLRPPLPFFRIRTPQKLRRFSYPSMDSQQGSSVEQLSEDFKNQKLTHDSNRTKLKLEELNWDHSFVRELPGDPRSDNIPRQVCLCNSLCSKICLCFCFNECYGLGSLLNGIWILGICC